MYHKRIIDKYLYEWMQKKSHKPLLLRGARQVGKSTAVRHLGENFDIYVEINFEKQPEYKAVFIQNLDVKRIVSQISALCGKRIIPGNTLLFLDEIQDCTEAIMSLRFFKEEMPDLHVIAAGSLLEFALNELPTFGVGRIHSMFMYPMSFDEFLMANGEDLLLKERNKASFELGLPETLHNKFVSLFRTYLLVGGMPEVVDKWVETHDYIQCQECQDDIVLGYESDFPKYKKKVDPNLLQDTLKSVAVQSTHKFIYSKVGQYKTEDIKKAIHLLSLAGLIVPINYSSANGLPLSSEADKSTRKMLLLDSGLMLRLLYLSLGSVSEITTQIITGRVADLVNKGPMAEQFVGLEMLAYQSPNVRHELYYWVRQSKNSQAEVDYILAHNQKVLPVEVKAGTQGGMKSLWYFLRDKKLHLAVRCSLENFGFFNYQDTEEGGNTRQVKVLPLYAISMLPDLLH